jgi:hypothetical protein
VGQKLKLEAFKTRATKVLRGYNYQMKDILSGKLTWKEKISFLPRRNEPRSLWHCTQIKPLKKLLTLPRNNHKTSFS